MCSQLSGRQRGAALGFALFSISLLVIPIVEWLFWDFCHQDAISFHNRLYYLVQLKIIDMDCNDSYYLVYVCDDLGFTCHPRYRSDAYGECLGINYKPLPTQARLVSDASHNTLYVELDHERFPIIP